MQGIFNKIISIFPVRKFGGNNQGTNIFKVLKKKKKPFKQEFRLQKNCPAKVRKKSRHIQIKYEGVCPVRNAKGNVVVWNKRIWITIWSYLKK